MTTLGTRFGVGEHVVQFYNDDRDLQSVLTPHLGGGLQDGDIGIVIATPAHRELLVEDLAECGIDVNGAIEDGQLIMLDASDTLDRFIRHGAPDADAFLASVGEVVRAACDRGRPVHAIGEMVALLWDRGEVSAVIELERLWNKLAESCDFSLVCAYRHRAITEAALASAFNDICGAHSSVIEGAPAISDAAASRRIGHSSAAPSVARRFVAEHLLADGQFDLVDGARLAASELVSNAIEHTDSDVTVGLRRTSTGVRVLVGDTSPEPPVLLPDAVNLAPGRGLRMIDVIADAWGYDLVPGGKIVWADLRPSY